jgi:soluble lytic murein transglycosylase-like protein
MQLMPQTATRFGVTNVFDPQQNIDAGTRYLKELLKRYHGDLALTLAAYNAGPDRVEQFRSVPPYRETRNYVRRVTERFQQTSGNSSQTLTLQ